MASAAGRNPTMVLSPLECAEKANGVKASIVSVDTAISSHVNNLTTARGSARGSLHQDMGGILPETAISINTVILIVQFTVNKCLLSMFMVWISCFFFSFHII